MKAFTSFDSKHTFFVSNASLQFTKNLIERETLENHITEVLRKINFSGHQSKYFWYQTSCTCLRACLSKNNIFTAPDNNGQSIINLSPKNRARNASTEQ